MSITNAENFTKNLASYLKSVPTNDERVIIAGNDGNLVLMSEADYNSLMETLYLYSIPGMRESIVEGANTPLEDCRPFNWREELK